MTGAERAIRWSTVAAVTGVAIIAGWVSYEHALTVVESHGEAGVLARLYPGTIDGLIYAASMALLDAARRRAAAPALARWLLGAGIAATLFVNVLAGVAHGPLGAAVAAWPAAALVGSYELLMAVIRGHAATPAPGGVAPQTAPAPGRTRTRARRPDAPRTRNHARTLAPGVTDQAAEVHFGADLAEGRVPSARRIKAGLHVGQARAAQIHDHLAAVAAATGQPALELSGRTT
jgi:hypothetical protein